MEMHFEMTFTCVLMKSKVSKLVFYLPCVLVFGSGWSRGGWVRDRGFGEIGLSNIQKISNKTMDFSESRLAGEK